MVVPVLDDDATAVRRKRLLFRAVRRGTRESDAVIGGFAKRHLHDFDPDQLDQFERLLERSDPELLGWIVGMQPIPPEFDGSVMALLKEFKNTLARS